MTFSQGSAGGAFNFGTARANDPHSFTRANQIRARLGLAPISEQAFFGQSGFGQSGVDIATFLAGRLGQQVPNLPALPNIPKAKEPPSRLNNRQISAAARRLRVAAARRKGRASTILGGSIGAEPEQKTLLGV